MTEKEFVKTAEKSGYADLITIKQYIKGRGRGYSYGEDDLRKVYLMQEKSDYRFEPNMIRDEWYENFGEGG